MTELVRVEPIALLPTSGGCAVFLGDGKKVIVFHIDPAIGNSIHTVLSGNKSPRPLSHDLFSQILDAFGAKVQSLTVVRHESEIFFAELLIQAENELMERKVVRLDARPSDGIALAVRAEAPIYFVKGVWDVLEDKSQVLKALQSGDADALEGGL